MSRQCVDWNATGDCVGWRNITDQAGAWFHEPMFWWAILIIVLAVAIAVGGGWFIVRWMKSSRLVTLVFVNPRTREFRIERKLPTERGVVIKNPKREGEIVLGGEYAYHGSRGAGFVVDEATGLCYDLPATDEDRDVKWIDKKYLIAARKDIRSQSLSKAHPPGLLGALTPYVPHMLVTTMLLVLGVGGMLLYVVMRI